MAEYIVSADTVSGCVTGNNCDYQKKGLFQMKNVIFQMNVLCSASWNSASVEEISSDCSGICCSYNRLSCAL